MSWFGEWFGASAEGGDTVVVGNVQRGAQTITQGDSYQTSPARPIVFYEDLDVADWPASLSGYTVKLFLALDTHNADDDSGSTTTLELAATVVDDEEVRVYMTTAQTDALYTGTAAYRYQLVAISGSVQQTLEVGLMTVLPKYEVSA